ncbi:TetR family transcriptional regulator [Pelistega sp. NLN82]|uniref:TetR family transcriptional regulator n=1 Tax=Pelistega ratti TaxID=2652177 RepID=A0A6L9Y4Z0_9BURK|nr:TetR family transcriptional regulator [Pelistega ratti]NEN75423.1 TetR family transcriptional regulator [Pelistega ratti]
MNKIKKVDLRVIKTKRAIQNALITLLDEKEFRDIQVQEIIERALINRSTFYKYYRGKSDLVGQLITDFRTNYQKIVRQRFESQNLRLFMQKIAITIEQHRALILALWKINTKRHHLRKDMDLILQDAFLHYATQQNPHKDWSYQAAMFATLALATNQYFFEQEKDLPIPAVFDMWQDIVDIAKRNEG